MWCWLRTVNTICMYILYVRKIRSHFVCVCVWPWQCCVSPAGSLTRDYGRVPDLWQQEVPSSGCTDTQAAATPIPSHQGPHATHWCWCCCFLRIHGGFLAVYFYCMENACGVVVHGSQYWKWSQRQLVHHLSDGLQAAPWWQRRNSTVSCWSCFLV